MLGFLCYAYHRNPNFQKGSKNCLMVVVIKCFIRKMYTLDGCATAGCKTGVGSFLDATFSSGAIHCNSACKNNNEKIRVFSEIENLS